MHTTAEHEAKYINAADYWATIVETATQMGKEIEEKPEAETDEIYYKRWAYIANRYVLRVLGLRANFYRMAAKDPTYAKLVLPILENRGESSPADDLDGAFRDSGIRSVQSDVQGGRHPES